MKSKLIYIISSIFLFLVNNNVLAQREGSSRGATDPGPDPDAVPINDYLWVLVLVGVVFAILKLKSFEKNFIRLSIKKLIYVIV